MAATPVIPSRPPGRPRSEHADKAIMQAALELISEECFVNVSMEAIAARAGVAKATVYRRWSSKAALVVDAFFNEMSPQFPFPDTGSVVEDFRQQMRSVARVLSSKWGRIYATLIGRGLHDTELAEALRARWLEMRRSEARMVLRRGMERGELRSDVNLDVILDALYGPIFYRLFLGHAPLTPEYAEEHCRLAMSGIALKK
jgi:AcrR family transcriptional regulator